MRKKLLLATLFVSLFAYLARSANLRLARVHRSNPADPFAPAVSCRFTLLNPREHGRHTCYAIQPTLSGLSFTL